MKIALLHGYYDAQKLESVKKEMQDLGAPTIKAVWMDCYDHWAALEGCHRIRAAADLGLVPVIEEIEYSEEVTLDEIGCDQSGDGCTIAEVCDDSFRAEIVAFYKLENE